MDASAGSGQLEPHRLSSLLEAGRSLVAEFDLEAVLTRLLEAARELTGARYGALGVLAEGRQELDRFLAVGMDPETREAIGELPRGRGILGRLVADPRPLRIDDIARHPAAHGFPPGHPKMTSFLGVPVMIRDEAFGNLYLTDKHGGDPFDEADEELLIALAGWAAIAIDHAHLHAAAAARQAELERAVRGLEATSALSRELGGEASGSHALELIAHRAREVLGARTAVVVEPAGEGIEVTAASGAGAEGLPGRAVEARGPLADVLRAGVGQRCHGAAAGFVRELGLEGSTALLAPLTAHRETSGVVLLVDRAGDGPRFGADDQRVLDTFASAAAAALRSARALEREQARLAIAASERERGRWARELHDETLQELGALKVAQESALLGADAEAMRRALQLANDQVERVITGLQSLITELRPASLDELGPQAAIEALAARVGAREGLEIELDLDLAFERGEAPDRHPAELEATVYRVVQEALNNVVKHAGATRAGIAVSEGAGRIAITVEDDGRGFDPDPGHEGFGLIGMRERVELAGGELGIGPGSRGGTRVRVVLPARSAGG